KINSELDMVLTASDWGCDTLRKNGVTIPIHKVPGGINPDKCRNVRPEWQSGQPFKYVHVGKAEERKGTRLLLQAFSRLREADPDVRLHMSINNPHIRNFDPWEWVWEQNID